MCRHFIFLSPYDLPDRHISRNFLFGKKLASLGDKVTILVNNYSHRDLTRVHNITNGFYNSEELDGMNVIWLNTPFYKGNGWGRAWNAIMFFLLSVRFISFHTKGKPYFIGDSVPPTAALSALIGAFIKRGKFIYQVRDVWPAALVYDGAMKRFSFIYYVLRRLEIMFYKRSFIICSAVPKVKEHIESSGGDYNKVLYLPNAINTPIPTLSLPTSRSVFTIIYAGGFGNAHDVETIIRAAAILRVQNYKVLFKIYGEGPKKVICRELVSQLQIDNVIFYSSVAKDKLFLEIQDSDLAIAAVTDSEAYKFGINLNKLYDYMQSSRPILLAIRSPHRIIEDANCGTMISPEDPELMADAIVHFIKMTVEERAVMGNHGRNFAEQNFDAFTLCEKFKHKLKLMESK